MSDRIVFRSQEEADEYIKQNGIRSLEDLTVMFEESESWGDFEEYVEDTGVNLTDMSHVEDKDIDSHNPDLPMSQDSMPHRSLWTIVKHGANDQQCAISHTQIIKNSAMTEENDTGKALGSLVAVGFAKRTTEGGNTYYWSKPKGQQMIERFGEPVSEVEGASVFESDPDNNDNPF